MKVQESAKNQFVLTIYYLGILVVVVAKVRHHGTVGDSLHANTSLLYHALRLVF
jgi:hypothetical protein